MREKERERRKQRERQKQNERERQKGKERERQEEIRNDDILEKNFCAYIKGLGSFCWRQK